eukprot:TRINITY_DN49690_c0_g1_i1.p1 TRINITY_DN49690_c0_g1~~TRINITY_DN49690_c0_g1_i1.p1  ORF type:complete len:692 (-),score=90.44 TRINITY_DN49690_c0_g1_i1:321-2396(-)
MDGPGNRLSEEAGAQRRAAKMDHRENSDESVSKRFSDVLDTVTGGTNRVEVQDHEPKEAQSTFPDPDAMKEKLLASLSRPPYDVSKFYKESGFWQWVARTDIFDKTTLGVISLNAFYISIETDNNTAVSPSQAHWTFQFSENFFCTYFTGEWFIRFMAFKNKCNGLRDFWFVFDSAMVTLMVFETWLMLLWMSVNPPDSGSAATGNTGSFKMLRLLRLSRMMRMAKLLRKMPELLVLVKGMAVACRSVFFTLILQFLALYIFGITFKIVATGTIIEPTFSTVWESIHFLLLHGSLNGVATAVFGSRIAEAGPLYLFLFYGFVFFSALTVMNMLIGVLCEVISAVAAVEHEGLQVSHVVGSLQEVTKLYGAEQNGETMISKTSYACVLNDVNAARALAEVGVDVCGMFDLADFIFEFENEQGETNDKELTFRDFVSLVLKLRGTNRSTVKDVQDLRKAIVSCNKGVVNRMQAVETRLRARIRNWWVQTVEPPLPVAAVPEDVAPQKILHDVLEQSAKCPTKAIVQPAWTAQAPTSRHVDGVECFRPELARLQRLRHHVGKSLALISRELRQAQLEESARVGSRPVVLLEFARPRPPLAPPMAMVGAAAAAPASKDASLDVAICQPSKRADALVVQPTRFPVEVPVEVPVETVGGVDSVRVTATVSVSLEVSVSDRGQQGKALSPREQLQERK